MGTFAVSAASEKGQAHRIRWAQHSSEELGVEQTADMNVAGLVPWPEQASMALAAAVKVLRTYGFDATADVADTKFAAEPLRSVVVAGEIKRGKSSLVNALLGVRVSPVGVDAATSITVSFVAATDDRPTGTADLVFPGRMQRIPASELPDWATVTGARVVDPATTELPTRAFVAVPPSPLGDVVVMDTPGVGGLDAVASRLSLQSAQRAGVLVLVTDATTPLTAPEMDFVRSSTATVESVIVVVSKTDKNVRRWKPIVAEDVRLLRTHLERALPVVGVSSVRASAAADLPVGDPRRASIEESSGITLLRSMIDGQLDDRAARGSGVDGLRTAVEGLRKVHARIGTDIAVTRDGAGALTELTAQRDRLQELKDHSGQWEQYLARDLTLARQSAIIDLDERLDAVRTKWTERINKSGMEVLRKNPQVFTADIEADLLAAMTGAVSVFLTRLRDVVMPLFDSEVVWGEIESTVFGSIRTDSLHTGPVASKRHGLLDPTVISMGMVGTSMLGALIGVGAVAGVVWVGVNLAFKAMRAGKSNLLAWQRETLVTARSSTARMLEAALAMSRPEIVVRYREHLKSRIEVVQEQIAAAKDAERADAAARDATLKRLMNNQRVVTARITEIEALLGGTPTAVSA